MPCSRGLGVTRGLRTVQRGLRTVQDFECSVFARYNSFRPRNRRTRLYEFGDIAVVHLPNGDEFNYSVLNWNGVPRVANDAGD